MTSGEGAVSKKVAINMPNIIVVAIGVGGTTEGGRLSQGHGLAVAGRWGADGLRGP